MSTEENALDLDTTFTVAEIRAAFIDATRDDWGVPCHYEGSLLATLARHRAEYDTKLAEAPAGHLRDYITEHGPAGMARARLMFAPAEEDE